MRIKVLSGGRKSIELPLSDAELNFQMKRIGIEETVPVCRLVEASEKDNPLCKFEGQTVNMDEVNFFAKRMDCLTEYERKVLYSYVTDYGVGTMQDLINLTFSMKGLSLITDFSDAEQVGKRLYLDEFIAMPEEEKQQTNFIKFAEKTFKESRVEVLPYGVFVEHGFEMQEVYNGKTFPEYFASDEIVAAIEVQNQAGDTEYLYLPTDICSMNKVKERLQVMDFWEMKVTDIHNIRLPDILVPMPENIDCVEALTLFNETCQAVRHFDEVQMKQLAMVVEFTGFSSHTEVTSLAKLLGEFEVNPFVHNDEEYGKYMVEESGLFDVDELLLPHINYASFAADKRQGTLVTSGYVEDGFVGATRELSEYQQYNGEFADPLEIDESCYETFRLYSPLTAGFYEEGFEQGKLYRSDLTPYAEEIAEAIEKEYCVGEEPRGLMFDNHGPDTRYTGPVEVAQTITSALGTGGNNTPLAVNKEPFCIAGNIVNRKEKNGGNGCGYQQGISYTLTTEDRHCIYIPHEQEEPYQKVIGSLCAGDEKMIGNQYVEQGKCIVDATRLVRRLIPLECERLMGFPDYWTDIPRASDSARYRALGNSVAVPCVDFILCGIAMYLSKMGEEEEDVYLSR